MFKHTIFFAMSSMIFLISGCDLSRVQQLGDAPKNFLKKSADHIHEVLVPNQTVRKSFELDKLIETPKPTWSSGDSFALSVKKAVLSDPNIIGAKEELAAQLSDIRITKTQADFQVSGTLYGGIEDISDETAGVALVLSASRSLYDGGQLDAKIVADTYSAESAKYALVAQMNKRSYDLAAIWIELERYELLNERIENRLAILDPLIEQLEKVAEAGVGDASKVAAAQRTVSTIKVTQTDVRENLEIARVNFINAFGGLPLNTSYDESFIKDLLPAEMTIRMIKETPAILADFSAYKAAEANLSAIKAQDAYNVGFETRLTRPFGGSDYDSDESVGLVVRKTLAQKKKMSAEIEKAEALIKSSLARLKNTMREGERAIKNAQQTIRSMDIAIELARESAEVTSNEIVFLRRQLIIGQSTLDNVLSAEARFYDAETKEINFESDKRKAEVLILSSLGIISRAVGISTTD